MKIGIFGGSFDPVHLEHVEIVNKVKKNFMLDKILVVPAYLPPHKTELKVSDLHRLNMLRLAFGKMSEDVKIEDFEIKSKKVVYTYQTVEYLKNIYCDDDLFLIVGSDSFNNFYLWKNIDEVADKCSFIVVQRNGYEVDKNSKFFKYTKISDFIGKISSTDIRDKIKNKVDIKNLIDIKVMEYIEKNELYK